MFVGHYSVAFAAKSEKNKIPLWILFIAVQFLDYIWATPVLLGIAFNTPINSPCARYPVMWKGGKAQYP